VQTAEGALSETTNILQRIRELAVQAANGTQSTNNRLSIDGEVQQLLQQIDTIATDTEFNGIRVLSAAQTENKVKVIIQNEDGFQQVLEGAIKNGFKIRNASVALPTLEDVFVSLTGRQLRDD
jgi:flagellin